MARIVCVSSPSVTTDQQITLQFGCLLFSSSLYCESLHKILVDVELIFISIMNVKKSGRIADINQKVAKNSG